MLDAGVSGAFYLLLLSVLLFYEDQKILMLWAGIRCHKRRECMTEHVARPARHGTVVETAT